MINKSRQLRVEKLSDEIHRNNISILKSFRGNDFRNISKGDKTLKHFMIDNAIEIFEDCSHDSIDSFIKSSLAVNRLDRFIDGMFSDGELKNLCGLELPVL